MLFQVQNLSKHVTQSDFAAIVAAGQNLMIDVARGWEIDTPNVRALVGKPSPLAIVAKLVDTNPGDGTLGFHYETNGRPAIEIDVTSILSAGGGVIDDNGTGLNVLGTLGHELAEATADPWCANWIAMPNGTSFLAFEVGDPGEAQPYYVLLGNGARALTSNIVLPRYFDAQAPTGSKLDLAGKMTAPQQNAGYQIIYDATKVDTQDGPISDVFSASTYHPKKLAWRQARLAAGAGRLAARKAKR